MIPPGLDIKEWSTDRKKNPLSSFPRREPVEGAHFPLSAVLRTLALCVKTGSPQSSEGSRGSRGLPIGEAEGSGGLDTLPEG